MRTRQHRMAPLVAFLFAVLFLCAGCNDTKRLVSQVKNAAPALQWQAWAVQVLERAKTNSSPVPRSEWPAFIASITPPCTEWQLFTGRNGSTSNISLVSLGGFGSFGIDIGPASFVEPTRPDEHCEQVYPGIYVVHN